MAWTNYRNTDVDKEICWILSNITVSNSTDTVLSILNNDVLLEKISECACCNSLGVVREACFVLAHILTLGSYEVVEFAICVKHIFDLIVPLLFEQD